MAFVDLAIPVKLLEAYDTDDAELDLVHYKYSRVLSDLLPPGRAFTRRADTVLQRLLAGLGMEFSRIQRGLRTMLREAAPGTATRTLSLWETLLGLPDCEEPTTLEGRRQVATAKLAAAAGHTQEVGWWAELFAGLGYELEAVENFGQYVMDCEGDCDEGLFDETWFFLIWLFTVHGGDDQVLACQVEAEQLLGFEVVLHWMWELQDIGAVDLRGLATTQDGWTVAVGMGGEIRRAKEFLDFWSPITPPVLFDLHAVASAGGKMLIAVGPDLGAGAGVLRSLDSGATWTQSVVLTADALYGVTRGYEDDDQVIAVGENGRIFEGAGAGGAWTELTSPVSSTLRSVTRADGVLVAVGDDGVVLRSDDLGATWTQETSGTTVALYGVAGRGDVVVAVGAATVIRSKDGGVTWAAVDIDTTEDLFAVVAAPSGRWTLCGASGVIASSTDDGATWTVTTVPTNDLYAAGYGALLGRAVVAGADSRIVLE